MQIAPGYLCLTKASKIFILSFIADIYSTIDNFMHTHIHGAFYFHKINIVTVKKLIGVAEESKIHPVA